MLALYLLILYIAQVSCVYNHDICADYRLGYGPITELTHVTRRINNFDMRHYLKDLNRLHAPAFGLRKGVNYYNIGINGTRPDVCHTMRPFCFRREDHQYGDPHCDHIQQPGYRPDRGFQRISRSGPLGPWLVRPANGLALGVIDDSQAQSPTYGFEFRALGLKGSTFIHDYDVVYDPNNYFYVLTDPNVEILNAQSWKDSYVLDTPTSMNITYDGVTTLEEPKRPFFPCEESTNVYTPYFSVCTLLPRNQYNIEAYTLEFPDTFFKNPDHIMAYFGRTAYEEDYFTDFDEVHNIFKRYDNIYQLNHRDKNVLLKFALYDLNYIHTNLNPLHALDDNSTFPDILEFNHTVFDRHFLVPNNSVHKFTTGKSNGVKQPTITQTGHSLVEEGPYIRVIQPTFVGAINFICSSECVQTTFGKVQNPSFIPARPALHMSPTIQQYGSYSRTQARYYLLDNNDYGGTTELDTNTRRRAEPGYFRGVSFRSNIFKTKSSDGYTRDFRDYPKHVFQIGGNTYMGRPQYIPKFMYIPPYIMTDWLKEQVLKDFLAYEHTEENSEFIPVVSFLGALCGLWAIVGCVYLFFVLWIFVELTVARTWSPYGSLLLRFYVLSGACTTMKYKLADPESYPSYIEESSVLFHELMRPIDHLFAIIFIILWPIWFIAVFARGLITLCVTGSKRKKEIKESTQ